MPARNEKIAVGSCFAGIGGLELGLEWTGGFETKWQIEINDYARAVLAKHWPNVRRYADIRYVSFPPRVDLIVGGFPCQDVSLAGQRKGLKGRRSTLWREMYRIICEVKPRWVLAENVPGLFASDDGRFFGNILRDLAVAGYDAEWGMLSAAGVGAPHLRRRVFILANAAGDRRREVGPGKLASSGPDRSADPFADADQIQLRNKPGRIGGTDGQDPAIARDDGQAQSLANAQRSKRRTGHSEGCRMERPDRLPQGKENPGRFGIGCPDVANAEGVGSRASGPAVDGAWRTDGLVGSGPFRDAAGPRLSDRRSAPLAIGEEKNPEFQPERPNWRTTECRLGRTSHGLSCGLDDCRGWECGIPRLAKGQKKRMNRLECLGNAVVPQVAMRIGEMILEAISG